MLELETNMKNYVDKQSIEDIKRQLQGLQNMNEDLKQNFESRMVDMGFKMTSQIKELLSESVNSLLKEFNNKLKHSEERIDELERQIRDKMGNANAGTREDMQRMIDSLRHTLTTQISQFERTLIGIDSKQKALDSELGNSIDIKISNMSR